MYEELVKRLRNRANGTFEEKCEGCEFTEDFPPCVHCTIKAFNDAADAIAELSRAAEVNAKRALKWAADAEKAEEKFRWIPVTERLPETARDVLVAFRLPIEKTYLITITQRASWSEKRKHDAFYQRGVTHWMEMPDPPKEEAR